MVSCTIFYTCENLWFIVHVFFYMGKNSFFLCMCEVFWHGEISTVSCTYKSRISRTCRLMYGLLPDFNYKRKVLYHLQMKSTVYITAGVLQIRAQRQAKIADLPSEGDQSWGDKGCLKSWLLQRIKSHDRSKLWNDVHALVIFENRLKKKSETLIEVNNAIWY